MKRYAKSPTLLAFLVFLAAGRVAMAGLPHPASWKQVSNNGQYVLVMVSPLSVDQDAGQLERDFSLSCSLNDNQFSLNGHRK
jgi:hypothetical protein